MNTVKTLFVAMLAMFGLSLSALATVPTEIATLVTDAGTLQGQVQDYAIVFIVFSVLIGIAWKLGRKRGA